MNETIKFGTPYSFKIKIVSTVSDTIMIGVLDYSKQKIQRSSFYSGNAICYYGDGGRIYGHGSTFKPGYYQEQIV